MSFHSIDGGSGLLPDLSVEVDVTNQPTNPVRVWTDITTSIRQLTFTRSGRPDEIQRTSPGTLSALVDNRSDVITTLGVRKAQWVRVQARWAGVTYSRWQGVFESVTRQWPGAGKDSTIELQAADVFKVFRLFDMGGQTFGAQRNDQRVAAVAVLASVPTGTIDTDTDAADAVVTPMTAGTTALSTLLDIEASENGLLVADPAGTLSFQGRHWRMLNAASPVAVIGDTYGIPYRDTVELVDDDSKIANIVSVTTAGGSPVTVTASDATSMAKYFDRSLARTLLTSNASVALDAANYLLNRYKDPAARIPTIEIPLAGVPSVLKPTLLAANNSTRFTWKRSATTPLSSDVYVEQISETIAPGSWNIQLLASPAGDEAGWVLGDSVLGVLDTTTRLVY